MPMIFKLKKIFFFSLFLTSPLWGAERLSEQQAKRQTMRTATFLQKEISSEQGFWTLFRQTLAKNRRDSCITFSNPVYDPTAPLPAGSLVLEANFSESAPKLKTN